MLSKYNTQNQIRQITCSQIHYYTWPTFHIQRTGNESIFFKQAAWDTCTSIESLLAGIWSAERMVLSGDSGRNIRSTARGVNTKLYNNSRNRSEPDRRRHTHKSTASRIQNYGIHFIGLWRCVNRNSGCFVKIRNTKGCPQGMMGTGVE